MADGPVGARFARRVADALNQPAVIRRRGAGESIAGKSLLITGASAGIGRAAAVLAAAAGARVVVVARRHEELESVRDQISGTGGEVLIRACDLTDSAAVDDLVGWVASDVGSLDVVVNNAGRSIRRPVTESLDRMHDFRRTMDINYFGAVQLTLGLLPTIMESDAGQIVNVGTWTVPAGTSPRFAAYHSSKMALTGFGRCLDAELAGDGVAVSTVCFPLVHTAMSSPTPEYRKLPGLSPEEAAEWILDAIRYRPVRIVPKYVPALGALNVIGPRALGRLLVRWG